MKGEKRRERRGREKEEEESQRKVWNLLSFVCNLYGNYDFVWIFGLLDFCMEFFDEEETINPFFFYEFGSIRTLLGILVVFWTWVV